MTEILDCIDPPQQHSHHRWHWARHEGDDKWFVFEAKNGRMWSGPDHMGSQYAYQVGWRYVGPAIPPAMEKMVTVKLGDDVLFETPLRLMQLPPVTGESIE